MDEIGIDYKSLIDDSVSHTPHSEGHTYFLSLFPISSLGAGYTISHDGDAVVLAFYQSLENIWSIVVLRLSSLCRFVHS